MAIEIKAGQSALCIKTVIMRGSGKEAFTKGVVYKSTIDGHLTDNQGEREHGVHSDECYTQEEAEFFKTHFQLLNEEGAIIGVKETTGKLNYELDFGFITQIAQRMSKNKDKYPPYNWQKLHDIEELKQALFRHVLAVMEGTYEDDGREFGHLEAIALNAMFLNYHAKKDK